MSRRQQYDPQQDDPRRQLLHAIVGFGGTRRFLGRQSLLFLAWLAWNSLPGISPRLRFDPFPFHWLSLLAALEAISLLPFVFLHHRVWREQAERHRQERAERLRHAEEERAEQRGGRGGDTW